MHLVENMNAEYEKCDIRHVDIPTVTSHNKQTRVHCAGVGGTDTMARQTCVVQVWVVGYKLVLPETVFCNIRECECEYSV